MVPGSSTRLKYTDCVEHYYALVGWGTGRMGLATYYVHTGACSKCLPDTSPRRTQASRCNTHATTGEQIRVRGVVCVYMVWRDWFVVVQIQHMHMHLHIIDVHMLRQLPTR